MGIAAYNRGSHNISIVDARLRKAHRAAMGLPYDQLDDPDRLPAKPNPRPEGWGAPTRARAAKYASGLAAHWRNRGVPFSAGDLVDALVCAGMCGRKTAESVASEVTP